MPPKVPVFFRDAAENVLVNYNFIDVVQGRGILNLYGLRKSDGNYALTPNIVYSSFQQESAGALATSSEHGVLTIAQNAALDLDFDIEISGRSIDVEGQVVVQVPLILGANIAGQSVSTTVTATLYHWDGSTETSLGSASKLVHTDTLGGSFSQGCIPTLIFEASAKKFNLGETVRLNIATTASGSNNKFVSVLHDPRDRTATDDSGAGTTPNPNETSVLKLDLPVRILQ